MSTAKVRLSHLWMACLLCPGANMRYSTNVSDFLILFINFVYFYLTFTYAR